MAQNLLDHSVPLDINLTISDQLAVQVYEAAAISGYKHSRVPQLQMLLANLISNHNTDLDLYTAVSQGNSIYKPTSRYNSHSIGKSFINLIRTMADDGWLEFHKGFLDRGSGTSRRSRIKPTQKLLELLAKLEALSLLVAYAPNTECIVVRDEDKQATDYEDTTDVIDQRRDLTAYNNLLHRTVINHPTFPAEGVAMKDGRIFKINPTDKFVRRIYNRSSFEWIGRFYGGWWQRIPSEHKKGIHINGWPTTELDYSSFHMVLLYALAGIDYGKEIRTDPYLLDEYDQSEQMRKLLKTLVLIAVNANSRRQALNAIRHMINTTNRVEFSWFREGTYNLEHILDLFIEKHKPIEDRFFNSDELSITNVDSDIAEYVIHYFTINNVPILSIHDSFLVPFISENALRYAMRKACEVVSEIRLGTSIEKTKITYEYGPIIDSKDADRTYLDTAEELNFVINTENNDIFNQSDFSKHKEIVEKHLSLVGTYDYYV